MKYRARHRLMRVASWLPDRVVRACERRWPCDLATCDGFWFDASYWAYCRRDRRHIRRHIDRALVDEVNRELDRRVFGL